MNLGFTSSVHHSAFLLHRFLNSVLRPQSSILMKDFRKAVTDERVYVFDGAIGTMIYSRGVYINKCYDELNLTQADLILAIHREYVKAGADIIETNTFGATRTKLQQYGLEDKIREINM